MDALQENELPFEQQIALLMEDLPAPLQKFLRGPERDAVSLQLSQKHRLRADQAGAFEQAYLYLLIGVNSPDEFVQDLKKAGIPDDTIRGLAADINEQVFKKLQREERMGPSAPVQPAPAVVPAAAVPVMPPAEKDSPASALQSSAYPREALAGAYQRASLTVRSALSSQTIADQIRSIRTGHRLPAQIAGELGTKVGFLMLGLMSTNELKNQMILAGTAPDAAQNTVDEIEQKILREFTVAPVQAVPASTPTPAAPAPVPVTPAEIPIVRTMATDMEHVKHPEQRQTTVHPTQASPARSFQTASVPNTVPAARPIPQAIPTVPAYTPPAPASPAPHSQWKPASPAPEPLTKQYGVDPYRELPE